MLYAFHNPKSAIPARHASKARRAGEIPNPQSEISLKIGLVFAALVIFKNRLLLKK
jgi:hypothetical protein